MAPKVNTVELKGLLRRLEQLLNAPIPGTPTIGGRVRYVPLPGRGRNRAHLTARAAQVFEYLQRKGGETAAGLAAGLKVNRNVIAGAMHELRKARLVRSEPFEGQRVRGGGRLATASASEYSHRPRKGKKRSKR